MLNKDRVLVETLVLFVGSLGPYAGKTKEERSTVPWVRKYGKFAYNEKPMASLKAALGDDWDLLKNGTSVAPHGHEFLS